MGSGFEDTRTGDGSRDGGASPPARSQSRGAPTLPPLLTKPCRLGAREPSDLPTVVGVSVSCNILYRVDKGPFLLLGMGLSKRRLISKFRGHDPCFCCEATSLYQGCKMDVYAIDTLVDPFPVQFIFLKRPESMEVEAGEVSSMHLGVGPYPGNREMDR